MLFVLTGRIQVGKTRWLEGLAGDLVAAGVPVRGVLAPGDWVASDGPRADAHGFEKRGIDQVLLPQGERIPFARRRDLAEAAGIADAASQSAQAQLGWAIDDAALAHVNAHLASLAPLADASGVAPGLLVVDELGRLELECGGGLVEALALLDRGPRPAWPHALAVARDRLADRAAERLGAAWGGARAIAPDEASRSAVLAAFSLA
ncbi:hypothetical protein [Adlercreutzia faecimuris]|uniref:NTPase n=1 Tax=Adlercreutzia faecimuris TaxID=2897341 RepID=A0ABS9WE74_9ACTN|nr:hypothetical protein [Adlercreutzia sp. JBNU-10]